MSCKKADKELLAAGKELDAARIHASNMGVSAGPGRVSSSTISSVSGEHQR